MMKKYRPLIFSALWPGWGLIYLRKFLNGLVHLLVWFILLSILLTTLPYPSLIDPSRRRYFIIWVAAALFWGSSFRETFKALKEKNTSSPLSLMLLPLGLILLFIFFLTPLKWRGFRGAVGNLHTHSTCSDGRGDYETLVSLARREGFDFLALTDHRLGSQGVCTRSEGCVDAMCEEVLRKCQSEKRLFCVLGQEVTGRVHILALGIESSIPAELEVAEIVQRIHEQGGLAIAAHPLEKAARFSEEELINSGFDAMECYPATHKQKKYLEALSQKYNLPCVYDSDTHEIGMLRTIYNACQGEIKNFEDLRGAIKGGLCRRFSPIDILLLEFLRPAQWL